jgi:hypothetical protein
MKIKRVAGLMMLLVAAISGLTRGAPTDDPETTCPVHKAEMKKDIVPAIYGLILLDTEDYFEQYKRAREELFPNSNREYYGGCVIDRNATKTKEVMYCPRCREAEEQWGRDHPVINPVNDKSRMSEKMPSWSEIRSRKQRRR